MDEQSGESKEEEVMGEGISWELKELVPEWGWRRDKGADSRDKMKHNDRSDQLFIFGEWCCQITAVKRGWKNFFCGDGMLVLQT